ncbi:MAG: HEAT repeat domain-containing protein [Verrucomicrobiae bacterium]|nr:HEAT repeat domain-containing protein [Verrucomicrobiae bacterium]
MKLTRLIPATVTLILPGCVALGAATAPTFEGAKWIWYSREPMPLSQSFRAGVHYFRGTLTLPARAQVRSAEMVITADNLYTVYINGKLAGEGHPDPNKWNQPKWFDVAAMLVLGRNVVAVEAVNTMPGAAALIVKLVARLADGNEVVLISDENWKCNGAEVSNWQQPGFDDKKWQAAHVVGEFGIRPWGKVAARGALVPAGEPQDEARKATAQEIERHKLVARRGGRPIPREVVEVKPPADYVWPEGIIFVGEDCSLYRPLEHKGNAYDSLNVTIFNPRDSRAFPEHDLPTPMKVGRKLFVLTPAKPGVKPRVLLDAGKGALGSPSVSFDGQWIYVSMAFDGEPFFHIYKLPASGGKPQKLTDGPFHDIDPVELPDGRIAFTSTRIGTFEEYHNPPSRALFAMNADGSDIRPLTHTFIFDNEPEVLADGRILFIRSDNFFDRAKVETLLHAVHPDGTGGYTEFGLDLGPEYGARLRAFHCGSPAPMPDGRVAYVTHTGIAVGRPGSAAQDIQNIGIEAGDVAALPDGRLLCTVPKKTPVEKVVRKQKRTIQDYSYEKIAIVDPQTKRDEVVVVFDSPDEPLHSPVYLGARAKPPLLATKVMPKQSDELRATGVLFCQNCRFTKNTTAGWQHVRAVRVLAGKGLTMRSSHSYIVHAGSDVRELGTVPLAPDGSFAVEVPADTAIALQAVDAEGRSELNEMSWIYVRPGEKRGCVGCHQPRQVAPPALSGAMQAMRTRPLKLLGEGQPHRFRGNNAAVTGLMELQFDRFREVAGINRHAVEQTISSGPTPRGAQEVAALIAQLKGADVGLKLSAIQRLAIFRDPIAAPALAGCLRDENRELRVATAMALAACGTRESVPPLLEALSDPDPLVAQAAAVALENLTGHTEPFNAFGEIGARNAQALRWRDWFQNTAWETIEADLVARVASPDRDRVRRAAVALGHIGRSEAARAALRDWLARERDKNPFPEWRKTHHGDGAKFNSLAEVNPRTLQAVTRALGGMKDTGAVPLLAETLGRHSDPATGNLFLAEACVEALGRIGTAAAETALISAFARLKDYPQYTYWYGDHSALMACHASPVHYLIVEALDAMGSARAGATVPHIIRSTPTDTDRALLPENDDCETLFGRLIRRSGAEACVVETCLAILGDPQAAKVPEIADAIATTHQAWGGKPDVENRAAQILSMVCRDRKYEVRVRRAFERYLARPNDDIPRVFDTGIPVVQKLPTKNWVCFFLARALGNLADPKSADALIAALKQSDPEAASGYPDPLGPGCLFLHNDLTPCWRACVAWALGRIGDQRAVPVLLEIVRDLKNAPDTRYAAAEALGRIADPDTAKFIRELAATYPEVSTRQALLNASARASGTSGQ